MTAAPSFKVVDVTARLFSTTLGAAACLPFPLAQSRPHHLLPFSSHLLLPPAAAAPAACPPRLEHEASSGDVLNLQVTSSEHKMQEEAWAASYPAAFNNRI
jgi:hypothetical protein